MTSLNPVYTVGDQICEALMLHRGIGPEARERTISVLRDVGIPAAETRVDAYPHQLSGGMKQRVMIAMALSCEPDLLIADEPTTALDVTIQAQILELLGTLKEERGMAIFMITHDLGVIAETADRVVVMYAGRGRDRPHGGAVRRPTHPYTRGLLASLPERAAPERACRRSRGWCRVPGLRADVGFAPAVPSPPRCAEPPPRHDVGDHHVVWCHHPLEAS